MKVLSEQTVAEARDELATVRKAVVDFGRENVAGIKLTVQSSSEGPITVQVVETLPGHVSMADVQVHPGYHPEKWTRSNGSHRMVFETDLSPWDEVETVYGVRASYDELDPFIDPPSIDVAREPTDDADDREEDDGSSDGGRDRAALRDRAAIEPIGDLATDVGVSPASAEPEPPAESDPGTGGPGDGTPSDSDPASPTAQEAADAEGAADREVPGTPSAGSQATVGSSADPFVYGETQSRHGSSGGHSDTEGMSGRDAREPATGETAADSSETAASIIEALTSAELTERQRTILKVNLGLSPTQDEGGDHPELASAAASLETLARTAEQFHDTLASPDPAVDELATAFDRLAGLVGELGTATKETVDEQTALQGRIEALERELARLQEDRATVEQLDARVSEIEELFDADETAAIGEVIAAERRWHRHRDRVPSR